MESTITAKGQTTIPKEVRDRLGLKTGSRVKYFIDMDGRVEILGVRSIADLRGIAKSPRKKPVSLKEMDDAIGAGVVERFKRATRN
jgi:AbrB family looped-hinge helix DNA binding protein